jgi:putative salt-induced outer membrane protein YdiY
MKLFVLLLVLASAAAFADEVRLVNGDRITGEIREVTRERLTVRTRYARTVSIELDEVQSLSIIDADGNAHEIGPLEVPGLNVKAYRRAPGVDYTGRLFGSAAFERGNAESDDFHLRGTLTARAERYRYELSGRLERRSEPEQDATTAWLGDGNYDRFLDEHHFLYVRGSVEHDRPKDIELRATAGAGYGRQFVESRQASLSVRAGLDHVSEDRFIGEDQRYPAFGWGIKGSVTPRGSGLELFHEQEGFWNLEDTEVVVLRSRSGVRVPLNARLKARVELNLEWERRPSPGRRSTDSVLLFGLDYDF